ncbi:hypothetical protein, conserved [Eimeria necatrix]|uniref:Uncharacterized protein n=1 Tax=Eimeria necatrix TaxID=51315 RepID=U6MWG0_9EIME|nr:hypothetical protein, conserved [Eimeria necatrix]CDJ66839.1 hypothetical protein, conserved [Eimeria necatrix]
MFLEEAWVERASRVSGACAASDTSLLRSFVSSSFSLSGVSIRFPFTAWGEGAELHWAATPALRELQKPTKRLGLRTVAWKKADEKTRRKLKLQMQHQQDEPQLLHDSLLEESPISFIALDEKGVAVGAVAAAMPNSEKEVLGAVVLSFGEDKQAMETELLVLLREAAAASSISKVELKVDARDSLSVAAAAAAGFTPLHVSVGPTQCQLTFAAAADAGIGPVASDEAIPFIIQRSENHAHGHDAPLRTAKAAPTAAAASRSSIYGNKGLFGLRENLLAHRRMRDSQIAAAASNAAAAAARQEAEAAAARKAAAAKAATAPLCSTPPRTAAATATESPRVLTTEAATAEQEEELHIDLRPRLAKLSVGVLVLLVGLFFVAPQRRIRGGGRNGRRSRGSSSSSKSSNKSPQQQQQVDHEVLQILDYIDRETRTNVGEPDVYSSPPYTYQYSEQALPFP